ARGSPPGRPGRGRRTEVAVTGRTFAVALFAALVLAGGGGSGSRGDDGISDVTGPQDTPGPDATPDGAGPDAGRDGMRWDAPTGDAGGADGTADARADVGPQDAVAADAADMDDAADAGEAMPDAGEPPIERPYAELPVAA